jgi:uncharacterized membrane protein
MATAIISTVGAGMAEEFFDFASSPTQWAILAGVGLLLIGAMIFGEFREPRSRLLLGALTALFVLPLVWINGFRWLEIEIGGVHLLFGAYVVSVFALALLTIWTGVQAGRPVLVNTGMVTSAILILTHYFSWSFELLDRSLAFIFGGLLLLGLAVVLEKKRRALLARMRLAQGETS